MLTYNQWRNEYDHEYYNDFDEEYFRLLYLCSEVGKSFGFKRDTCTRLFDLICFNSYYDRYHNRAYTVDDIRNINPDEIKLSRHYSDVDISRPLEKNTMIYNLLKTLHEYLQDNDDDIFTY